MRDYYGEIKLIPPGPGHCPVCAGTHEKDMPHDRDSLYYQFRFRRKYKRFPTWEDAMSHCSEPTKERYREYLKKKGIAPEETGVAPNKTREK